MDSQFNNYNPFEGFNPGTALQDLRNQMMDAYGQMQQRQQQQPMQQPMSQGPMASPVEMPNPGTPFGNYGGVQNQWQSQWGIQNNPFMQTMMQQPAMPPQPMGQASPMQQPMQNNPFTQPNAGGIAGYGLPVGQGAPGGNAVNWLAGQGMPIPSFVQQISNGQAVGAGNYNDVVQQLGGVQGLMSPQTLNNLNPSELEFLQGFFETVLGIPFNDIISAAYRPFNGLGNAQQAGFSWQ